MRSPLLTLILVLASASVLQAQLTDANLSDYNQWKLALDAGGVANPVAISAPPGYKVEIVRTAGAGEGSWISLAFDPQGRIIIAREDKGLLRCTPAPDGKSLAKVETIENTLLECRGLLFAHGALYVTANNSRGLYRLRDTDGDDTYDEVKLLRALAGGVGHGRNGLALGPDGMIYVVCGNNVQVPAETSPHSPYRNYGQDRLLPCVWNEFLFDSDTVTPYGHVARTDTEGKTWELVAGGFRNPYGLAFNPEGDLFTYDADMEWDEGASWYRPTCVMHVVPGGEYGWRQETNLWPDFFADALPRVCDIGLGSPTGVAFGTHSKFPPKHRQALFILDWSYGRIIAVHLTPRGSSYTGKAETFIKGKPLNLTDIDFGPDGAMYFTVGGRGTQSALYRVSYAGPEVKEEQPAGSGSAGLRLLRERRRELEKQAAAPTVENLDLAWKNLDGIDPFLRAAARVVLENHPPENLDALAQASDGGMKRAQELLLAARVAKPASRGQLLAKFDGLLGERALVPQQRLATYRALQVTLVRLGQPTDKERDALLLRLDRLYPAESFAENYLLCELLLHLRSPTVVAKTMALLPTAATQQEKFFYLFALRHEKTGWSGADRRRYLELLKQAESFAGANYLSRFVTFIRSDVLATLSLEERTDFASLIESLGKSEELEPDQSSVASRKEVRQWTLDELLAAVAEAKDQPRNLERGKEMFAVALCNRCHRLGGSGGVIGPNLAGAAARFGRKDLLDAIVNPSKVVDDKYRDVRILTVDGEVFVGQLAGGDAEHLFITTNALEPARITTLRRDQIETRQPSFLSTMPTGLLSTLTAEEVLDLLAWLEAGK